MNILLAILIATPLALWFAVWIAVEYGKATVQQRLNALPDVTPEHKDAAWACFERADAITPWWRTLWDHLRAPFVLLLPLRKLPREADDLPDSLAYWRNNVSINGDGEWVERDGKQLTRGHDIPWEDLRPGEVVRRYDDPAYTGDAYYAKSHHPRSWYARWIWLAFRNVASQRDVDNGVDIAERPQVLASGDGWQLLHATSSPPPLAGEGQGGGDGLASGAGVYQWSSGDKWGPLQVRRNVGFKLGILMNRPPAGDALHSSPFKGEAGRGIDGVSTDGVQASAANPHPSPPPDGEGVNGRATARAELTNRASAIATWAAFKLKG